MANTALLTTADLIRSHDFTQVGDGYAIIRAAGQLARGSSLAKLASLIDGLQDRLLEVGRIRDLKLRERLQQMSVPLVNPADGQVLGLQNTAPGGLQRLQSDLTSAGLVAQVESWHYLKITQDTTPPVSVTQFVSPAQIAYVQGLMSADPVRDMGSFFGIRQYESIEQQGGSTVRTVFAIGESAIKTLSTVEMDRLEAGVQALTDRLTSELQGLMDQVMAEQQSSARERLQADLVDAGQQHRIRRFLLGLSDKP